jgi:hypothetical protein
MSGTHCIRREARAGGSRRASNAPLPLDAPSPGEWEALSDGEADVEKRLQFRALRPVGMRGLLRPYRAQAISSSPDPG